MNGENRNLNLEALSAPQTWEEMLGRSLAVWLYVWAARLLFLLPPVCLFLLGNPEVEPWWWRSAALTLAAAAFLITAVMGGLGKSLIIGLPLAFLSGAWGFWGADLSWTHPVAIAAIAVYGLVGALACEIAVSKPKFEYSQRIDESLRLLELAVIEQSRGTPNLSLAQAAVKRARAGIEEALTQVKRQYLDMVVERPSQHLGFLAFTVREIERKLEQLGPTPDPQKVLVIMGEIRDFVQSNGALGAALAALKGYYPKKLQPLFGWVCFGGVLLFLILA